MKMETVQKIPPWATTIITGICGVALIWIATDMKNDVNAVRDDVKTVREKVDVIAPSVAVHSTIFNNYDKLIGDLQRRVERLEERRP